MTKLIENQTVQNLRKNGFKVRVMHQRYHSAMNDTLYPRRNFEDTFSNLDISPRGGVTTIQVTAPNGDEYEGVSKCSQKDSFNRKLGNKIALGRLEKKN